MITNALDLLNHWEQEWLVKRIRKAEKFTTGEIRVHLEDYSQQSPLERAVDVFASLNMHKTDHRNGVLIYIAVNQHAFSVIGDVAINNVTSESFWQEQVNLLTVYFNKHLFYEGIILVIKNISQVLQTHFPLGNHNNPNELPDEISYG